MGWPSSEVSIGSEGLLVMRDALGLYLDDGQIVKLTETPHRPAYTLAPRRAHRTGGRPGGQGRSDRAAFLVAGCMSYRRRLLLYARLPAWHRGPRGRSSLARSHLAYRAGDPLWDVADVPPRRRGEPTRAGFDRDARGPALVLEGEAVHLMLTGVRGHLLVGYDYPLGILRRTSSRTRSFRDTSKTKKSPSPSCC